MNTFSKRLFLLVTLAVANQELTAMPPPEPPLLNFEQVNYHHRWSKDSQHEYTPQGQEDLNHWSNMITINRYEKATDGEGLAAVANAVLENYKSHEAMVLKTDSVPRTPTQPAEYLIVVLFPRPEYIEAVFARFKLLSGTGCAMIYSHRENGKKAGNEMSAWLQKNGPQVEQHLMAWAPAL